MIQRVYGMIAGIGLSVCGIACSQTMPSTPELDSKWKDASVFDLKAESIDGKPVSFSSYKGKVLLVVNTASRCGFTPQYKDLQALHEELGPKGLVILGFPSNDFGGQEPGTEAEIKEFCSSTYKVTFPMFKKVVTKPGKDQSAVYECLGTKSGKVPGWNFGKYLVSRDGDSVTFYGSRAKPMGGALRKAILKALAEATPQSADATAK